MKVRTALLGLYLALAPVGCEEDIQKRREHLVEILDEKGAAAGREVYNGYRGALTTTSAELKALERLVFEKEVEEKVQRKFNEEFEKSPEKAREYLASLEKKPGNFGVLEKKLIPRDEAFFYQAFNDADKINQDLVKEYLELFPRGKYVDLFQREFLLNIFGNVERAIDSEDYENVLTSLRQGAADIQRYGRYGTKVELDLGPVETKVREFEKGKWEKVTPQTAIGTKVRVSKRWDTKFNERYVEDRRRVFPEGSVGTLHEVKDDQAIVTFKDMNRDWPSDWDLTGFGYKVIPGKNNKFAAFRLSELLYDSPIDMDREKLRSAFERLLTHYSNLGMQTPLAEQPEEVR